MNNQIIGEKLDALENEVKAKVQKLLQDNIGIEWKVDFLSHSSLCFGVIDETGEYSLKFGQCCYLDFSRGVGGSNFKMNLGTTGTFSLIEEKDYVGRMKFYIGIGKFLENKPLLHQLQHMLNEYYNEWNSLYDQREK